MFLHSFHLQSFLLYVIQSHLLFASYHYLISGLGIYNSLYYLHLIYIFSYYNNHAPILIQIELHNHPIFHHVEIPIPNYFFLYFVIGLSQYEKNVHIFQDNWLKRDMIKSKDTFVSHIARTIADEMSVGTFQN